MTRASGVTGYQPGVIIQRINPEKKKYVKMWNVPEYRSFAPGEDFAVGFLLQAKPKWGAEVIDFGCGTGRSAMQLVRAGMKVTMLDFAENCLDPEVREELGKTDNVHFFVHDLEYPIPKVAEYGYCTDLMEHIPEEKVDTVLTHILMAAQHVFFAICTCEDGFGKQLGETLHLTVKSFDWWKEKLESRGARISWSDYGSPRENPKRDEYALFYCTGWSDVAEMVKHGEVNTDEDIVRLNIEINSKGDWLEMEPFEEQDTEVMILGGGPSLSEFEGSIRTMREEGIKLVTLNGTYNWCLERGIIPSATILVDARPFNKRFVTPVVDKCKYFISSQCDPPVFEGLPKDRTYIWHDGADRTKEILGKEYFPVIGGSTVLLRAIPLLRMLGYHRFHLFGCDSCLMPVKGASPFAPAPHHAFSQPENDGQIITPVIVNGRVFHCNPWMAIQAREFVELVKVMGEHIDMIVYGDGLLSYLIKTGAELPVEEE